ncbi:hypothetical protein, partial [Clavibacter phaseoli]|uniref:hypothetical protein n=1 Tax=Clavibacter phaseoli TaxID=1734031 RepID=UPI001C7177D9
MPAHRVGLDEERDERGAPDRVGAPFGGAADGGAGLDVATYIGTDNEAAGGKAGDFLKGSL